jgi:hypothetical protein
MPIEFEYLDDGLGFGFTAKGNFLGEELIEAASSAYQSEEILRKNKYGIIDYSPVEKFDVAASDIEAVADLCIEASKISPDRLIAVVAHSNLSFGYSRMWEMLSESTCWERMVFRKRDDAVKWLKQRAMEQFDIAITLK